MSITQHHKGRANCPTFFVSISLPLNLPHKAFLYVVWCVTLPYALKCNREPFTDDLRVCVCK